MGSRPKRNRLAKSILSPLAEGSDHPISLSPSDEAIANIIRYHNPASPASIGFPSGSFRATEVTHNSMCWAPFGLPTGQSILIASSRLNSKLDELPDWFDALRTLAVQLAGQDVFFVTADRTTTDRYVKRIGKLFKIPVLTLKTIPEDANGDWIENNSGQSDCANDSNNRILFWKPLDNWDESRIRPAMDQVLISIAHQVILLSVRNNGNVFRGSQTRLESEPRNTRLLMNRVLTPKRVEKHLIDLGVTAWWLYDQDARPSPNIPKCTSRQTYSNNFHTLTLDEIKSENYLIHWTRRRVGPWPDQSSDSFLDELIFQMPGRHHNQVSALCRILASKRILGTNQLTRDRRPVVCFSEIKLREISRKRVFRPHLSRWDVEPYGIAIDRDLLEKHAAHPVEYGTHDDWKSMEDNRRPFFQLSQTDPQKPNWESEKEWRILGDLNLDSVPSDRALVFVRTTAEAEFISDLSRWPILILEPNKPSEAKPS